MKSVQPELVEGMTYFNGRIELIRTFYALRDLVQDQQKL
jgi:hypothetical protein